MANQSDAINPRITPQFSGGALPYDARRTYIMK
jgi:hypothetical protein